MSAPSSTPTSPANGDTTSTGAATPGHVTVNTAPVSKAQAHVDAVNTLMATGLSKADSVKQVAQDHGVASGTVYGSLRKVAGTPSTPRAARKDTTTPVDPVEAAKALLQGALDSIDTEVQQLKEAADQAQAAYKTAKDGAADRRKSLKAKIAALSA